MGMRKLTPGNVATVFARMLAMDDGDREPVEEAINHVLSSASGASRELLRGTFAETLATILDVSLEEQRLLLPRIDAALDALLDDDLLGADGQLDPRGERR